MFFVQDNLLESRRASKGEEIYTGQLEAVREETWLKDMVRREADLVRRIQAGVGFN